MNKYLVTADYLNLRKDPSLTGKICGSMRAGEVVECFKISGDDYWLKIRNDQGVQGWATHKHLVSLAHDTDISNEKFPWMTVAIRELGKRPYSGYSNNPRIESYLSSVNLGLNHPAQDDIYWSSAFANWCVEKAGCDGTDSAWAKSWHNWGKPIENPERGCVVVLRKGNANHVGFFVQALNNKVEILGANKLNEVCYHYFNQDTVLSYRVPFDINA